MAFKAPKKPPQFADLKGILAQSKDTENPLYQVVEQLIDRLTQLKLVTLDEDTVKEKVLPIIPISPPISPIPGAHAPTHMPGGSDVLPMSSASKLLGSGATLSGFIKELSIGTGLIFSGDILVVNGIPESVITDGTILARVAANETITGTWTFTTNPVFNANSIPETAIIDGAILARVAANETITGSWTFNNPASGYNFNDSNVFFTHPFPQFFFIESDQAVDAKTWRILIDGGLFQFGTMNDARTVFAPAVQVTRSGNTIATIAFITAGITRASIGSTGVLTHTGALALASATNQALASDQTAWNPTGLGTSNLIVVTMGANFTVRGMLAQPHGTIVSIFINSGFGITFTHQDASASAVNRFFLNSMASLSTSPYQTITFMWTSALGGWLVLGNSRG